MRHLLSLASAALVALMALGPVTAFGAPVAFESVKVDVQPHETDTVMIVAGQLPESVPLPARVELAVPAGGDLQWIGETLGGAPDQDPTVAYEVKSADGIDIYTFTMSKSRTAQIELVRSDVLSQTSQGTLANVTWTPSVDVAELSIGVRLPQTAKIVQTAEGAATTPGPTGYSYYTREIENAKAGEPVTLNFAYAVGAAAPATAAGSTTGSDSVALVLILGVALAAFVFVALGIARKARARAAASAPATPARERESRRKDAEPAPSENEDAVAPPARRGHTQVLVLTGVIVVMGIIAVVALSAGGKASVVNDVATLQITPGEACTTANIPLTPPQGASLDRDVNRILEHLKSVPGVTYASIHLKESRIEVGYCDSSTTQGAIEAALAPSGYVTVSSPAPSGEATVTP